nr:uncharacterized protein LOC124808993 [Hydra vulgaris]
MQIKKKKSSLILPFEFATIKKASNESVMEFLRQIARAAEGCKFMDRDDRMRDQFIMEFNDGVTIKLESEELTFAKAVKIAVTLERVTQEARQLDGSDNLMIAATSLLPKTSSVSDTNKVTCFSFGKLGHFARDCEAKCRTCSHNHQAKFITTLGGAVQVLGEMVIKLEIDGIHRIVNSLVVKEKPLGFDLILGMNAIEKFGGVIIYGNKNRIVRMLACDTANVVPLKHQDFAANFDGKKWRALWNWNKDPVIDNTISEYKMNHEYKRSYRKEMNGLILTFLYHITN